MKSQQRLRSSRSGFLSVLVLVCVSVLAYLALIQPWSLRQASLPLQVGNVAPQDLRAPRDVEYVSQVRTEEARLAAERAIAPVYALPDLTVARSQIEKLNSILLSISSIRSDEHTAIDQKKVALSSLLDVTFQPASIDFLLKISPTRWDVVQNQALDVLEKVMQNNIRSEDLETVLAGLPSLVSFTLTESESTLVAELVSPLVAANSFYSPELTDAVRQAARDAVLPVAQTYAKGQMIVSRGQIISGADFEALSRLGLVRPENPMMNYLGPAALVVLVAIFTTLYFVRRRSLLLGDLRSLILLAFLFLIFLIGARVSIPNRTILPYLYPIPAFGLLISALFGMESGMVFSLLMSALASYGMPDALGLLPYYILTSMCGVLALGQARRVGQFLYAAAAIAGAGMAMVIAYRLPFTETDWIGLVTLLGATAFYGIASPSIALPLQYLLAQFLGLTTALQLLEISRPDFPLLKYFLQRAPGTYQHSLQVANLAEQAAESIGADGLLTRVGALFHDVGKAVNPLFFVENQPANQINPHNDMHPKKSAEIIICHVTDGLKLVKRYRLPRRLHDFVAEHHGTLITRYQFNRAVEAAGGDRERVDAEKYRYNGPEPRSRETAILMLADGVEACARAERPQNDGEVHSIVRNVIERVQKENQLDHTPLTQHDLLTITESFVTTLRVTYHPRLEYPQEQPPTSLETPTVPRRASSKKGK